MCHRNEQMPAVSVDGAPMEWRSPKARCRAAPIPPTPRPNAAESTPDAVASTRGRHPPDTSYGSPPPNRLNQAGVLGKDIASRAGGESVIARSASSRKGDASDARVRRVLVVLRQERPEATTDQSHEQPARVARPDHPRVSAAERNRRRSRSLVVTQPRATAWSYRSMSRPVSLRSSGTTSRNSGLPGDAAAFGKENELDLLSTGMDRWDVFPGNVSWG